MCFLQFYTDIKSPCLIRNLQYIIHCIHHLHGYTYVFRLQSKNMYMCFTPAMLKWVGNMTNIYSIAMLQVKCAKNTIMAMVSYKIKI